MIDRTNLWIVIVILGLGSYALRFVFIGIVGSRPIPAWILRHLRYTAVAILPALVAPLVVWPKATDGQIDMPRLAATVVALAAGYYSRNMIVAILAGGATLYVGLALAG